MRKNIFFICLILLLCTVNIKIEAKQIDANEAFNFANSFLNTKTGSKLKSTRSASMPLRLSDEIKIDGSTKVYAYDCSDNNGFVLVAGDDQVNTVLGYSSEGHFDYNSLPSNVKSMIDSYANQIALLQSKGYKAASQKTSEKSVEPLVTAEWDQESPYNDLAPIYENEKCLTGCVATAMSQVMFYYKWPVSGTGNNTYTSEYIGQELSVDFTKSVYDWENMTDTYDSESSEASNAAVAKLMYDCGVATNMEYNISKYGGSGTSIVAQASALVDNFGYDKGLRVLFLDYYKYSNWCDMMKSELDAARPILYSASDKSQEGHAFVVDGYDTQGLFHVNWGWSGSYNGYFILGILNPETPGKDGVESDRSFSYGHSVLLGMQKPKEDTKEIPYFLTYSSVNVTQNLTDDHSVDITSFNLINNGYKAFSGKINGAIVNTATNERVLDFDIINDVTIEPAQSGSVGKTVKIENIPEGEYTINYYSIDSNGNEEAILAEPYFTNFPKIVVDEKGDVSVRMRVSLVATDISFVPKAYNVENQEYTFVAHTDVTNNGYESCVGKYSYNVSILATDVNFSKEYDSDVEIAVDETKSFDDDVKFVITEPFSSSHFMTLTTSFGGSLLSIKSQKFSPFLLMNGTAVFENDAAVEPSKFKVEVPVTNISNQVYNGNILCEIYLKSGKVLKDSIIQELILEPNETKTLTFEKKYEVG